MTMPSHSVRGTLFVVAAPSGAGKTTLVHALLAREAGIALSVSHTTRAPRSGERDGVDYHFVSREVFARMLAADQFFEHAEVHGDLKGTSVAGVTPLLDAGQDVMLEIDWQGAQQVRAKVPDCQSIFVLPPSREELEHRLRARASDSEAAIEQRLANSRIEISHANEFDYIVVNDQFDAALASLHAIVAAVRLRAAVQRLRHADLITALLGQ